ncbi:MAG: hypothetical protein OEZ47_02575, partial [Gammaproteobacteria bacterium]|nr:hypothetical protein [Gammaproteobacteria bacterium]
SKVNAISNLFLSLVTGRMAYYARGGFTQSPLEHWEDQWELISSGLFRMTQEQLETAEVAG